MFFALSLNVNAEENESGGGAGQSFNDYGNEIDDNGHVSHGWILYQLSRTSGGWYYEYELEVDGLAYVTGCSKDDISQMHLMYNESRGLPSTSIDSVKTFTTKFSNYLRTNPEGWKDEYCNPTIENMKYACTVFGYKLEVTTVAFRFNTEWGEGQTINFD